MRFVPGVVTGLKPAKNDRGRIGSVEVKMKNENGDAQEVTAIETVLFVGMFLRSWVRVSVLLTFFIQTALARHIMD